MSKQSRRRARRNRRLRAQQTAEKSIMGKLWRRIKPKLSIKRIIEIAIALIGLISAYIGILGFWMPRISVQPLETMNPRDALSSGFSLTNQGVMDIYDVSIGVSFVNFKLRYISPEEIVKNAPPGTEPHYEFIRRTSNQPEEPQIGDIAATVPVASQHKRIAPMRSATLEIPYSLPNEEQIAIDVIVWYRPAWYPFTRFETFRFITRTALDGKIQWVPRPD